MDVVVRPPEGSEFQQWRDLWEGYLTFYETELSAGHAGDLWRRIHDPESYIRCLVAADGDRLVGLVHFFPHEDTWSDKPICYLEDLYVDASHRGQGIGALLIRSVVDQAESDGWSGVYWLTADDNHRARTLYDRLAGGPSGFIHYEIEA